MRHLLSKTTKHFEFHVFHMAGFNDEEIQPNMATLLMLRIFITVSLLWERKIRISTTKL